MGYYTKYKLKFEVLERVTNELKEFVERASERGLTVPTTFQRLADEKNIEDLVIEDMERSDSCPNYDGLIQFYDGRADSGKWYDHESDMRAFSKRWPTVLFTLDGEGEAADDIWREYYLAGKMQQEKARIVIADFDPNKLK